MSATRFLNPYSFTVTNVIYPLDTFFVHYSKIILNQNIAYMFFGQNCGLQIYLLLIMIQLLAIAKHQIDRQIDRQRDRQIDRDKTRQIH